MAASLPAYFTQLPQMDIAWLAVAYAQGLSPLECMPQCSMAHSNISLVTRSFVVQIRA
jgi:hypothetical protein